MWLTLALLILGSCSDPAEGPTIDAGNTTAPTEPVGPCPGAIGCPCGDASPCADSPCIKTPEGRRCALPCADGCPTSWVCGADNGGEPTLADFCVPRWGQLCDPCTQNSQCPSTAQPDAICIDRGDAGAFCGATCAKDSDCPADYGCQDVKDVQGQTTRQCVYLPSDCICTRAAREAKRSTWCKRNTPKGICLGARSCMIEGMPGWPPGGGLSTCYILKPQTEVCDGIDNDCDGTTDERVCL